MISFCLFVVAQYGCKTKHVNPILIPYNRCLDKKDSVFFMRKKKQKIGMYIRKCIALKTWSNTVSRDSLESQIKMKL